MSYTEELMMQAIQMLIKRIGEIEKRSFGWTDEQVDNHTRTQWAKVVLDNEKALTGEDALSKYKKIAKQQISYDYKKDEYLLYDNISEEEAKYLEKYEAAKKIVDDVLKFG